MSRRIGVLERNQAPATKSKPGQGVIYVIKASDTMDNLVKIGRTKDLAARLRSHSSADADALDVIYVYKTNCVKDVEACIKRFIRPTQYRKYKEVYNIDLDVLKKVIQACGSACLETIFHRRGRSSQKGGYYAVVHPLEE